MTQFSALSLMTMPDTILGSQFFPPAAYSPSQKLCLALLANSLFELQKGQRSQTTTRGKRIYEEERAWIGIDDYEDPCSFVNLCVALGLDIAYMRRGFRAVEGSPPAQHTRLGLAGEVLPEGVYLARKKPRRPYRVRIYAEPGERYVYFVTIDEAHEFYLRTQHQRPRRKGVAWERRKLFRATISHYPCALCGQQITRGEQYRLSWKRNWTKAAHEVCVKAQTQQVAA